MAGIVATKKYGRRKKTKYNTNAGVVLVTVVLVCFLVVMGFRMKSLEATARSYQAQVTALQSDLEAQEERAEELEESKAYVQTRQYVEQIARERLGLVGSDETVVKPSE